MTLRERFNKLVDDALQEGKTPIIVYPELEQDKEMAMDEERNKDRPEGSYTYIYGPDYGIGPQFHHSKPLNSSQAKSMKKKFDSIVNNAVKNNKVPIVVLPEKGQSKEQAMTEEKNKERDPSKQYEYIYGPDYGYGPDSKGSNPTSNLTSKMKDAEKKEEEEKEDIKEVLSPKAVEGDKLSTSSKEIGPAASSNILKANSDIIQSKLLDGSQVERSSPQTHTLFLPNQVFKNGIYTRLKYKSEILSRKPIWYMDETSGIENFSNYFEYLINKFRLSIRYLNNSDGFFHDIPDEYRSPFNVRITSPDKIGIDPFKLLEEPMDDNLPGVIFDGLKPLFGSKRIDNFQYVRDVIALPYEVSFQKQLHEWNKSMIVDPSTFVKYLSVVDDKKITYPLTYDVDYIEQQNLFLHPTTMMSLSYMCFKNRVIRQHVVNLVKSVIADNVIVPFMSPSYLTALITDIIGLRIGQATLINKLPALLTSQHALTYFANLFTALLCGEFCCLNVDIKTTWDASLYISCIVMLVFVPRSVFMSEIAQHIINYVVYYTAIAYLRSSEKLLQYGMTAQKIRSDMQYDSYVSNIFSRSSQIVNFFKNPFLDKGKTGFSPMPEYASLYMPRERYYRYPTGELRTFYDVTPPDRWYDFTNFVYSLGNLDFSMSGTKIESNAVISLLHYLANQEQNFVKMINFYYEVLSNLALVPYAFPLYRNTLYDYEKAVLNVKPEDALSGLFLSSWAETTIMSPNVSDVIFGIRLDEYFSLLIFYYHTLNNMWRVDFGARPDYFKVSYILKTVLDMVPDVGGFKNILLETFTKKQPSTALNFPPYSDIKLYVPESHIMKYEKAYEIVNIYSEDFYYTDRLYETPNAEQIIDENSPIRYRYVIKDYDNIEYIDHDKLIRLVKQGTISQWRALNRSNKTTICWLFPIKFNIVYVDDFPKEDYNAIEIVKPITQSDELYKLNSVNIYYILQNRQLNSIALVNYLLEFPRWYVEPLGYINEKYTFILSLPSKIISYNKFIKLFDVSTVKRVYTN